MPDRRNRLAKLHLEHERLVAHTRELLAKSLEMLGTDAPDTFLGRKTQEPFPKEQMSGGRLTTSKPKPA